MKAAREAQKRHASRLKAEVRSLGESLAGLKERLEQAEGPGSRWRLRFEIHHKRRRLAQLESRLALVEQDLNRVVPRMCFGSNRLFRRQFHLKENGYRTHGEWLKTWRRARSSQFLCLGSKDETGGNQTCTLLPEGTLRLRLPHVVAESLGKKWLLVPGIRFRYGQEAVDRALARGQALTYRFLRRERQGKSAWYVQVMLEREDAPVVTSGRVGALGVDLNPGLVAASQVDRHGNPVSWRHIPVLTRGRRQEQVTASLAEAVADLVAWARAEAVPVVVEKLDFEKKKARLREMGARYARMLSGFAYGKFHALLLSRAAREGVEVVFVNPALTSVIGQVKFGPGYGLSPHAAAAVAIARRGLGFGERLRSRSALLLPARNRGRHVWSDWSRLSRRLRAERARGRCPSEGDRGRGPPLSRAAPAAALRPQGPPGDGLSPVPGRDPPAQMVGRAVRPASQQCAAICSYC
ncbi:MAG: IS200/IS605 family accessory protein TnpB-related protein [Bacillota bacterium]|nr:IS200/IS605 family accessory protein TnpB-related protein [Bacillota bacterium]